MSSFDCRVITIAAATTPRARTARGKIRRLFSPEVNSQQKTSMKEDIEHQAALGQGFQQDFVVRIVVDGHIEVGKAERGAHEAEDEVPDVVTPIEDEEGEEVEADDQDEDEGPLDQVYPHEIAQENRRVDGRLSVDIDPVEPPLFVARVGLQHERVFFAPVTHEAGRQIHRVDRAEARVVMPVRIAPSAKISMPFR